MIDSAEKRRSAGGVSFPLGPGVTPNSAKDAEWRAQAGWSYSGIAAGTPASPPPGGPNRTFYVSRTSTFYVEARRGTFYVPKRKTFYAEAA